MASALEMERKRKLMSMGVTPYEGDEPFIFISYAHKDFDRVIPTVKMLLDQGYRVWYDEGIDPGTEWDEIIATHVENCYCMVSFVSANYLASDNCLDELSYARDQKKEQLFIYLEDLQLPGKLALRFGRRQAIFQHAYADQNQFNQKLFSANVLKPANEKNASNLEKAEPEIAPAELENAIPERVASDMENAEPPKETADPENAVSANANSDMENAGSAKSVSAVKTVDMSAISALFEFEQEGDSITVTRVRDKECAEVEIPWGVTGIGEYAFMFCKKLTAVTIPDSVTHIGECAFSFCKNLSAVTIGEGVTGIGARAFSGCKSLSGITIPNGITRIEYGTFSGCKKLTGVTIPGSVTAIEECAFLLCSKNLAILGEGGSYAEQYAKKNHIPFCPI